MTKTEIKHEQKELIKKAEETIRQVEKVKECEVLYQKLYHEEAEGYIRTINKGVEEYRKKAKRV